MGKYSIHGASGIDNHRSSPGGISLGLSATDKGKLGEDRRCWADFKAFFFYNRQTKTQIYGNWNLLQTNYMAKY